MADSQGGVKHLYTKDMKETSLELQRNIDDFQDAVEKVSKATTKLLSTWAVNREIDLRLNIISCLGNLRILRGHFMISMMLL